MNNLSTGNEQNLFHGRAVGTDTRNTSASMQILHPHSHAGTPTVLYLDDNAANRQAFNAAFRKEFKVLLAANLTEAWQQLDQNSVHVIIADQRMPDTKGSVALSLVRERYPSVRRMLVTAFADLQAVVDALNHGGVCYYIQKPWEVDAVLKAVANAFSEIKAEQDREAYTARLLESNQQLEFALRQRLLS